ncbi:hypothetical protein EJB05_38492, partial [Eragrostis curvula]
LQGSISDKKIKNGPNIPRAARPCPLLRSLSASLISKGKKKQEIKILRPHPTSELHSYHAFRFCFCPPPLPVLTRGERERAGRGRVRSYSGTMVTLVGGGEASREPRTRRAPLQPPRDLCLPPFEGREGGVPPTPESCFARWCPELELKQVEPWSAGENLRISKIHATLFRWRELLGNFA